MSAKGTDSMYTAVNEATLIISVLKRIPRNRWITSVEIRNSLAEVGIDLNPRRMQRLLKAIIDSPDLNVEIDRRSKPYGYRRSIPDSDLTGSLGAQESLLLRLCQERMHLLLPPRITKTLEPLFEAAKETFNERGTNPKNREWLQKVAFVSNSMPMLPPKIKQRIFEAVSEALFRDSKLRIDYVNGVGRQLSGIVSPLGLVQQGQRLYLVCRFETHDDLRHLALHRITDAEVLECSAERPADFSLERYVKSRHFNYSNGRKVHLKIEFTNPRTATNMRETPFNGTQTIEEFEPGRYRLEADLDDSVKLRGWIAEWREAGGFSLVEISEISDGKVV